MNAGITTIALVIHEAKGEAAEVATRLERGAVKRGLEVVPPSGDVAGADVIVGIGGDGVLLKAASLAMNLDVPVVGVNLGRVGYLAEFEPDDLDTMLQALVDGTLQEMQRMTIKATLEDGSSWFGINDIVLEKVQSQRLVQLAIHINGEYFTTYRADGIIVASPLGSTAYSLSAGGPVLDPQLESLILTPVAPHSLLSRSIVLAPDAKITCVVELDRAVRLNVDGRDTEVLDPGATVNVERGSKPIRFLTIAGYPFPQGVRRQFGLDHA